MDSTQRKLKLARVMALGSVIILILGIVVKLLPQLEGDATQFLSHVIICYAGMAVVLSLFLRNSALFRNRPRVHMWAIVVDAILLCFSVVFRGIDLSGESQQIYAVGTVLCYMAFALLVVLVCVDIVRTGKYRQSNTEQEDE